MEYPKEYLKFLIHFHGDRDYFECHEVLEEYWKEVDPGNRNSVWVGLIQVAVGFYHYRRENRTGAERILVKGKRILQEHPGSLSRLGINPQELQALLEETLKKINSDIKYQSVDLPLNIELKQYCGSECEKDGEPGHISESVIHRHILRDRTDVIRLREKALQSRHTKRD